MSQAAEEVRAAGITLVRHTELSEALFRDKAAIISQLHTLAEECVAPDWDGNGAYPINPRAVLVAEAFLRALPEGVPLPELAPEPDGSISVDWLPRRHRILSLSASASDRIAYAWLDGTDSGHAVARFDGTNIPLRILKEIESVTNYRNASVRPA